MDSNLYKPIRTFNHVFGIFSEMQNGYSFNDAASNAGRVLGFDSEYYGPVFSKVLGRLIQSSPWTGGQKSGMNSIRRAFNRGGLSGRDARSSLEGLGLSPATAGQVVRQWEDHMPGFDAPGFEGLGEESIVLRPNQVEQRRESRMRREAEAAAQARSDELQGDLFAATERKKSKYNGVLVDKFPEGLEVAAPVITSAKHPSIRYRVLCELVAPERRWMVASALSGELDSRLYSMYQEAGGSDVVNIRDTGENGRVSLKVDTGSGVSTEVDLGGNLETGYVVQSINDPLGIFPEGTEQGDFLEFGTVEVVLKSLGGGEGGNGGLMASGYVRSSASPGDHVELRYKSEDDSSNKFINMDYSGGPSFTATWGRFGSAGRQTEYPVAQWDSYYRGKRSKGYTDVTDGESVVPRVRRDVPVRPEPVARSVPNMEAPPPVPQKPKRQDPRQLELFASGRSKISSRFFTGG